MKSIGLALSFLLFAFAPQASWAAEAAGGLRVLHKVYPDYPYAARDRHLEGSGLLELKLRPDGSVRAVSILRSSGHAILDEAAVAAFRQWRFSPGVTDHVKLPFFFTMKGMRY
jgi:protein TonB